MSALEFLFFAVFGQTTPDTLKVKDTSQPEWTLYLFKLVFGIYMLVSVVVLINLLIAMMSDTYQRIQVQYHNTLLILFLNYFCLYKSLCINVYGCKRWLY